MSQKNTSWVKIGGTILILLIVAWFAKSALLPSPQEQVKAEYMIPYPKVYQPAQKLGSEAQVIDRAYTQYQNGDYEGFIKALKSVDPQVIDKNLSFYWANADLALGNYDLARARFESLTQKGAYKKKAEYYLALFDIQDGKLRTARRTLNGIMKDAPPSAYVRLQAEEVLDVIGR